MNAKVLIVALCAFQLAAGDIFTDAVNRISGSAINIISQGNQSVNSFEQKLTEAAKNAAANVALQWQTRLQNINQTIYAELSSAQQAAPKVQACLKNLTDTYAAIYNSTQNKTQAESQTERASIQPYVDKIKSIRSEAANLITDFTECVGNPTLFNITFKGPRCLLATMNKATALTSQMQSAVGEAIKVQASIAIQGPIQRAAIYQEAAADYQEAYNQAVQCVDEATREAAATTAAAEPDSTTSAVSSS